MLVNEIEGLRSRSRPLPNVDKANLHIHFLQFDVQGSDGVPTGGAFEQAARPFAKFDQATPLLGPAASGADRVAIGNAGMFHPGATVAIGIDQSLEVFETARILAIQGNELVFATALQSDHRAGELVTAEFVRYRYFVARQNGAVYFHDHVDALRRWGRGLFGALVAEPTGATYHDPQTGDEIVSGPVADIHTEREVVPGLIGAFREFVLFFGDRTPEVRTSLNMRAEPVAASTRRGRSGAQTFSSSEHGDPITPVFEAYAGDPIMMRVLTGATEEIHPLIVTGHQFRAERFRADSHLVNSVNVGISERFNAYIESAGGPMERPGDYLFFDGIERHLIEGVWGLLRVHGARTDALLPLPGHEPPAEIPADIPAGDRQAAGDPCPADAPLREYSVRALRLPITINTGGRQSDSTDRREGPQFINGLRYVLDSDRADPESAAASGRPLVLRANAGDCLQILFINPTFNALGFTIEGANFDPANSYGGEIGFGPNSTTPAGSSRTHRFYLPSELGALRIRDFGNPFVNIERQLYGTLIVEPEGASYHDPLTNAPIEGGVAAVIRLPDGTFFREFVTMLVDQDIRIGRFVMPYQEEVRGDVPVNYRFEPLSRRYDRLGDPGDPDQAMLFAEARHGPPETELFVAEAGDQIRFRVVRCILGAATGLFR